MLNRFQLPHYYWPAYT